MLSAPDTNNTDNTDIDTKIPEENQEDFLKQYEEMYKAGVHFGYSRSSWNPGMQPYLFGVRNNVEIFNLEKVTACLEKAEEFLKEAGKKGGKLLFVATKPETKEIVEEFASGLGMPYVVERWLGGTLTNFKTIRKQIDYFESLLEQKASGGFSKMLKKEAVRLEKKMESMKKKFWGLRLLHELPGALLIVDPKEERTAVLEAYKTGVPVVAIMNSDCSPKKIAYPVPGNDTASSSIKYLLGRLVNAYKK